MQHSIHHPAMTRAEAALIPAQLPAPSTLGQALLHAPGITLPGAAFSPRKKHGGSSLAHFVFMCYNNNRCSWQHMRP